MHKVFYVTDMSITDGAIASGETDGKLFDKDYLKINGDYIHVAVVFLDTPENRQRIEGFREEYTMWKREEPNVYAMLNNMQRIPKN